MLHVMETMPFLFLVIYHVINIWKQKRFQKLYRSFIITRTLQMFKR